MEVLCQTQSTLQEDRRSVDVRVPSSGSFAKCGQCITSLIDLMFGIKLDSNAPRLLSISSDRTIVCLVTHIALCMSKVSPS